MSGGTNLGFSSDTVKSTTTSNATKDVKSTSQTTGKSSQSQQQKQLQTSLDAKTQQTLSDLISGLGVGSFTASKDTTNQLLSVIDQIRTGSNVAPVVEAARVKGERQIGQNTTQLAQSVGSSQNSLVQQLNLQAQNDLTTQLAGLQAGLQGQNLNTAAGLLQGATTQQQAPLLQLVSLLKGATTSGSTTASSETNTLQNTLATLLEKVTSTSSSKAKKSGFSLGGFIDTQP